MMSVKRGIKDLDIVAHQVLDSLIKNKTILSSIFNNNCVTCRLPKSQGFLLILLIIVLKLYYIMMFGKLP